MQWDDNLKHIELRPEHPYPIREGTIVDIYDQGRWLEVEEKIDWRTAKRYNVKREWVQWSSKAKE